MALVFVSGLLFWVWIEISAFIFVSNVVGGLLTLSGFSNGHCWHYFSEKTRPVPAKSRSSRSAKGHAPVISVVTVFHW